MTEFSDKELIDALQITLIMLAVERKRLTKVTAAKALGMTFKEFDAVRKDAIESGYGLAMKLQDARRAAAA